MRGGGEDSDGMNIRIGGGRLLPKLNKCGQEVSGDPNVGPCVIT